MKKLCCTSETPSISISCSSLAWVPPIKGNHRFHFISVRLLRLKPGQTWSKFQDELLNVGKRIPKLVFLVCIGFCFGRSLDTTASRVFEIWFGYPFISFRAQAVLMTTCWCVQGHSVICLLRGCLRNSCFSKIRQTGTSLDFHQQSRVRVCRTLHLVYVLHLWKHICPNALECNSDKNQSKPKQMWARWHNLT